MMMCLQWYVHFIKLCTIYMQVLPLINACWLGTVGSNVYLYQIFIRLTARRTHLASHSYLLCSARVGIDGSHPGRSVSRETGSGHPPRASVPPLRQDCAFYQRHRPCRGQSHAVSGPPPPHAHTRMHWWMWPFEASSLGGFSYWWKFHSRPGCEKLSTLIHPIKISFIDFTLKKCAAPPICIHRLHSLCCVGIQTPFSGETRWLPSALMRPWSWRGDTICRSLSNPSLMRYVTLDNVFTVLSFLHFHEKFVQNPSQICTEHKSCEIDPVKLKESENLDTNRVRGKALAMAFDI